MTGQSYHCANETWRAGIGQGVYAVLLSLKDPANDYFVLGGLTVCLYHKWILVIVHSVFYTTVGSPSRQSQGGLPKPAKGCCSAAMSEFWYGTGRRAPPSMTRAATVISRNSYKKESTKSTRRAAGGRGSIEH